MQTYKILWKIRSPLQTSLESDTIFGHLCWAYRYDRDENALSEFLEEVEKGKLLLTSAFPAGFLPLPCLPETEQNFDLAFALHPENYHDESEKYQLKKQLKKMNYLPVEIWEELKSAFSPARLYDKILSQKNRISCPEEIFVSNIRNRINRNNGSTGEGNLFTERLRYFPENTVLESYLTTDFFDINELKNLFNYIVNTGFGKKKSIGRGSFQIDIIPHEFDNITDPDAHLVLSNMIPADDDPREAYWIGKTKFAKVSGSYALTKAPFKYPFYHFLPGTVFLGGNPPKGILLSNIHPDLPQVKQHLLCFSLPFKWEGKNEC